MFKINFKGFLLKSNRALGVVATVIFVMFLSGPVQINAQDTKPAISAGAYHTASLKNDGTVWTWGANGSGQLGDGTTTSHPTPVQVSEFSNVIAIAAGASHTAALKNDGTVWAWGANNFCQLGNGTTSNSSTPVKVSGLSDVTAIATGNSHTLALKSDGTVWAWGYNNLGQLGNGTTSNSSTPVQVSGLFNVTAIASRGGSHTVVLKNDGTVWAWGSNFAGQLGNGTTVNSSTPIQVSGLSNVIAVTAGSSHTAALKNDGTVWAWGYNSYGQLGDGTITSRSTPVKVSEVSNVTAIAAGSSHTAALKSDGTVWAWGKNSDGQLGDGTKVNCSTPVQASGVSNVIAIAVGYSHTTALKNDNAVWVWGSNTEGQVGDGSTANTSIALQVKGSGGVGYLSLIANKLTVSKTGSGSVASTPSGIDCGTDCAENYASGTIINLTATAATNSVFTGWSGACSGVTPDCQVTMSQAQNVTAAFSSAVPNISAAPADYDFEDLNVGSSFIPTQTFTVSNNGAGNLNIGNLTITNSDDFTISGCSGQILAPSQTCEIKVASSPKSVGVKTATISIPSDDPDTSNLTVSVRVNGVSIQKPLLSLLSTEQGTTPIVSPVLKSTKGTPSTLQKEVESCGNWVPVGFGVKDVYNPDPLAKDPVVTAIAFDKSKKVMYVGGSFKTATHKEGSNTADVTVNGIAKWDTATEKWSPLGSGVTGGYVTAILIHSTGDVYVGGTFTHAGGKLVNHIAKWSSSGWSALGSGTNIGTDKTVASLATDPTDLSNRYLYVGGDFTYAGGVKTSSRVARWDINTSTWKKVGGSLTNGYVNSLVVDKTGQLYIGGYFTFTPDSESSYKNVAKLIKFGSIEIWSPLNTNQNLDWNSDYFYTGIGVNTLAVDGKNNLYAGGAFKINNNPLETLARAIVMHNGTDWSGLKQYGLSNLVAALAVDGENNLYAGGFFSSASDVPYNTVNKIAKWDGTQWIAVGNGFNNGNVQSLAFDNDGNLYAGGTFNIAGGSNIAKWTDCMKPCPQPVTIESVKSGGWKEAGTWNLNRIPNSSDVVLVKKEHTVTGTANNSTVKGLCNYGTLQSDTTTWQEKECSGWWLWRKCKWVNRSASGLNLTATDFVNNYGRIQGVRNNSDNITLSTSGKFINYPGAKVFGGYGWLIGGSVSVSAKQIVNYGTAEIRGGNTSTSGIWYLPNPKGGSVFAISKNDFINYGVICGGSGYTRGSAKGSGSPNFNNGSNCGLIVTIDPQYLSLLEDAKIEADEVIIVGGDDAVLDLSGLKEGTIITNKLTIAVGKGGTVDLKGTPANALQATEVEIFADNIVLDEGKQLTDAVNSANIRVEAAKILYDVSIIPPGELAGKMGEILPVKIAIANTGPKVDTYIISVTSKLGWQLSGVSSVMTVETHEQGELSFNVALPLIEENGQGEDTLTVTATSQSDPTVSHSLEVKVSAAKQIFETTIDEDTGKLIAIDETGNVIDVEQLIQENEENATDQSMSGTMTDENGNPMPGVTIKIGDQTVVTDADGNWAIAELSEGSYTVTVSKDGKVLSSSEVTVGSDGIIVDTESGSDTDRDGVTDDNDAFPNDSNESLDSDGDGTGNNADTDDDNDEMPDVWETANGLNPLVNDASTDSDGDGYSNLDEYTEGTNPNDPDDYPEISCSDPATCPGFRAGTFKVGKTGIVKVDYLYDGGMYEGELGIFSLAGMDSLEPNSSEFIAEAVKRVLSDSEQGCMAISDKTEGARFSGQLGSGKEPNRNKGIYKGLKSCKMNPGDTFATVLVPNATFTALAQNPGTTDPAKRPIFSLASSNPEHEMYFGQMAKIEDIGNAFVFEDMAVKGSDRDYNDLIIQILGVTVSAPTLDNPELGFTNDWRKSQNPVIPHIEVSPPSPDTLWMTITLKSPADLFVYDPQGNVIGKEGGNIPGATFETDADGHQIVSLPKLDSGEYRVVLRAVGEGGLCHLEVKGYKGDSELAAKETPFTIGAHETFTTVISADDFFGSTVIDFAAPDFPVSESGKVLHYDFNGDGRIDDADIVRVSAIWNTCRGEENYDLFLDLDGDGCITVKDIMKVAGEK